MNIERDFRSLSGEVEALKSRVRDLKDSTQEGPVESPSNV